MQTIIVIGWNLQERQRLSAKFRRIFPDSDLESAERYDWMSWVRKLGTRSDQFCNETVVPHSVKRLLQENCDPVTPDAEGVHHVLCDPSEFMTAAVLPTTEAVL